MKLLTASILLFISLCSVGQQTTTIFYDSTGKIITGNFKDLIYPNTAALKDSASGSVYILDSSRIYVSAYSSTGELLWKTDPYRDNKIPEYRTSRPIIVDMWFGKIDLRYPTKGKTVLRINYNNTQAGYLDFKTGSYNFLGQN
jgi:hypothetical protein